VLERAINVLDGKNIDLAHLPLYLRDLELENTCGKETNTENKPSTIKPPLPLQPLKETFAEVENKTPFYRHWTLQMEISRMRLSCWKSVKLVSMRNANCMGLTSKDCSSRQLSIKHK
jgi:hypothetical protein